MLGVFLHQTLRSILSMLEYPGTIVLLVRGLIGMLPRVYVRPIGSIVILVCATFVMASVSFSKSNSKGAIDVRMADRVES